MSTSAGRALCVGYGRMGKFHAKVLRDLGYEVVTVDPDPATGADHRSLDEVIPTRTFFDVAAVAVPLEHLVATAYQTAGIPRILVEKPFAANTREAGMLAAYLRQQGSAVCVGLIERLNPQVRALRSFIHQPRLPHERIMRVKFTRWNDRPSFDVGLDLKLHDVDLALWLGVDTVAEFDTAAGLGARSRFVRVEYPSDVRVFDLMDHSLSPLHALWHAFLTDGEYPTPEDVIHAHRFLDLLRDTERAAA